MHLKWYSSKSETSQVEGSNEDSMEQLDDYEGSGLALFHVSDSLDYLGEK